MVSQLFKSPSLGFPHSPFADVLQCGDLLLAHTTRTLSRGCEQGSYGGDEILPRPKGILQRVQEPFQVFCGEAGQEAMKGLGKPV